AAEVLEHALERVRVLAERLGGVLGDQLVGDQRLDALALLRVPVEVDLNLPVHVRSSSPLCLVAASPYGSGGRRGNPRSAGGGNPRPGSVRTRTCQATLRGGTEGVRARDDQADRRR